MRIVVVVVVVVVRVTPNNKTSHHAHLVGDMGGLFADGYDDVVVDSPCTPLANEHGNDSVLFTEPLGPIP